MTKPKIYNLVSHVSHNLVKFSSLRLQEEMIRTIQKYGRLTLDKQGTVKFSLVQIFHLVWLVYL